MKPNPYADAPRLPESDLIDPRQVVGAGLRAVELEIGPGRGGFMFERLAADPSVFMVGLEIRRKWATVVDRRLGARGYGGRARVFAEDARQVLPKLLPGSLSVVYLHFPDPWWKKRHQKRLVMAPDFVASIARALLPGGGLFLQTDVEERAQAYEAMLSETRELGPAGPSASVDENPFAARSPRERRAMADGLPIYRLQYVRL